MGLNLPDLYGSWTQARENGRQRVLGQQVNEAMPGALQGDQTALQRLLKLDPGRGMQVQGHVASQQKAQQEQVAAAQKRAAQAAAQVLRAVQSGDQAALQGTWAAFRETMPSAPIPNDFTPDQLPDIHKVMALGGGEAEDNTPSAIRELQMLQANPELRALDLERRRSPQWRTDDDGNPYWAIPGGGLTPVAMGQPPMPAPTTGGGGMLMGDAIQSVESANNPNAVSPKGARGLMQLMPATAREIERALGMPPGETDRNPEANRKAGEWYYQQQLQRFGDPRLALAAYNGGPNRLASHLQATGGNPDAALSRMPAETRAYVPKVMGRAQGGAQGVSGPTFGKKDARSQNAPSGYQWTPDGTLAPITGGPADRKNNPMPADMAKDERQMRRELADLNKEPRQILDAYKRVEAASRNPNAASDLSLIFGYMKMLDPGSVVREGEFANAQNAAGVPDRIVNIYNKAKSGERLSPNQRQQFVAEAQKLRDLAASQMAQREMEYGEMAEQYGYDPRRATGSQLGTPQARQQYQKAMDLIQKGRAAIQAGADRNAVKQRLIQMGFKNAAEQL